MIQYCIHPLSEATIFLSSHKINKWRLILPSTQLTIYNIPFSINTTYLICFLVKTPNPKLHLSIYTF